MRAAVLHHHLAIDVAGGIRNQETRQITELAMFAGAAERIPRGPITVTAFRAKLTGCAGGRKRAGRDRHRSDALRPPCGLVDWCLATSSPGTEANKATKIWGWRGMASEPLRGSAAATKELKRVKWVTEVT